jgi:UDP-GlcNAc:undecaprenyl-phosphate/decaprenyl-phosphate GlcNAc-1-phosphate transferase
MPIKENISLIVLIFSCAMFICALIVNNVLLRFSKTLGLRNNPEQNVRWSKISKPSMGGIGFYLIFLISFIAAILIEASIGVKFDISKIIGVFLSVTFAFIMGLADDAYDTKPILKFCVQMLCGLVLVISGIYIHLFKYEILNYILTIFWVVALMNSINMLDNMDGIATLVSIPILIFSLFIEVYFSKPLEFSPLFFIIIGMLTALSGFLFYNWFPSKMFMGDSGSQILGVFLAILGIQYCWNTGTSTTTSVNYSLSFILPVLVFLMPIIDTTIVSTNRILKGSSPFVGGKDHTTHNLFFMGLTERRIAVIFTLFQFANAAFAYYLFVNRHIWSISYFFISLSYIILLLLIFFYIVLRKK